MLPLLRVILNSPAKYAHDIVTAAAADECFVCKEPYATDSNTDACCPIRLRACGHVIGDKCFARWIQEHPGTCLHYSHPLPISEDDHDRRLRELCETAWFVFWDDFSTYAVDPQGSGENDTYSLWYKDMEQQRKDLIASTLPLKCAISMWAKRVRVVLRFSALLVGWFFFALVAAPSLLWGLCTGRWSYYWWSKLAGAAVAIWVLNGVAFAVVSLAFVLVPLRRRVKRA